MNKDLIFLKLGGSLITNKDIPRSPRLEIIHALAEEVKDILQRMPEVKMILGHGSGSFGHTSANRFNTRQGVETRAEWLGFAEVWWEAASLNHLVLEALHRVNLPAISFPLSSSGVSRDGQIHSLNLRSLHAALAEDLLPVFYGDVAFDTIRGGTILSTEDIFSHLAISLHPGRILLAGNEQGVWSDYPKCTQLLPEITPGNYEKSLPNISGSVATDVTGGMISKVETMLSLVNRIPGLAVQIFSGIPTQNISRVFMGENLGTKIHQGVK